MDTLLLTQNQLLVTKFHVPVALDRRLISRPRLTALLNESLKRPFTLVSAPAGFGKTTLLSTWSQSLLPKHPRVAWVSLDEEDNDPRQFWTYVLTALKMQQPDRFTELLMQLQSPQPLPIKYVLAALINLLADGTDDFLLILDDYQMITEQEIHTILAYLIEHLPPQLHIILATRADPPLPLPLLRARQQALEVRTDQLRCTVEETRTFFEKVIGIHLPAETIQEVTTRTEGWLVGLQLLGLSLPEHANSLTLLEQASGDQRYILDYLTQEVLQRQSQEVQAFLLSTSILERLSASLCDTIMERSGSQQMLKQLEQANLFVVPLDTKRQWYRYHALFAEVLSYRLEQRHADRLSSLHHRASLWYAEHDQTTQAIVHAFKAQQLQWAADLIERKGRQLMSFTWGASRHALAMLQGWIEQLPTEVMYSRPRLCLACTQLLWQVAPRKTVQAWLDAAETILTASLTTQTHEDSQSSTLDPEVLQDLKNLLGEVITFRAVVRGHEEDGEAVLPLCQQALALLSPNNVGARGLALWAQVRILYCSSVNDAADALECWIEAGRRIQATGETALAIAILGGAGLYMTGTGQLRKIYQVTQETMQLARQPEGGSVLPELCWPASFHAEILREWNQLDQALALIEEAILLSPQTTTIIPIAHAIYVLVMLIRIALSRGELERARSALQELEHIENHMNRPLALHYHSLFTTVDQVRLWLACGERDRALRWAEELDLGAPHRTPFAREREEVAYARVRLATQQPVLALERLESVLQRARAGRRWGHVIEIRLLQALAHQMCHEISQALEALSEAVRLAEPEGFIRSFVEEGAPMAALLCSLREEQRKAGVTPYLDTLLAAFPQKSQIHEHRLKQAAGHTTSQPLLDPLSERELEVLQLLAEGASNQEIAQALVIALDTVKRHVSHIFSKLGVQNRIQAMEKARELRLLDIRKE